MAEHIDNNTDQVHGDVGSKTDREQEQSEACKPCKFDNNIHPPVGWCETCDELLCNECYNVHCRPLITRNHQLWPLEEMENRKQRKKIANKCKTHGNKTLKYFCEDHTELGCSQCFVSKHRQCSKVVCISEVNTVESDEFKALQLLLSELGKRLKTVDERTEINVSITDRQHDEAIASIQEAGEKLKKFIDTLVKEQVAKAEVAKGDNIRNIKEVKKMNQEITNKLSTVRDMIAAEQGDNNQLFITMKNLQAVAKLSESMLDDSEQKNIVKKYKFVFNPELVQLLETVTELGSLKDTLELSIDKATDEVVDEFEVRCFLQQHREGICQEGNIRTELMDISTDHDIRLLDVLLYRYLKGKTNIGVCIQDIGGDRIYIGYSVNAEADEDIVVVKIKESGVRGATLRKGRQYSVVTVVTGGTNIRCLGKVCIRETTVGGVKFTISNPNKENASPVDGSHFHGFRFVPL